MLFYLFQDEIVGPTFNLFIIELNIPDFEFKFYKQPSPLKNY